MAVRKVMGQEVSTDLIAATPTRDNLTRFSMPQLLETFKSDNAVKRTLPALNADKQWDLLATVLVSLKGVKGVTASEMRNGLAGFQALGSGVFGCVRSW